MGSLIGNRVIQIGRRRTQLLMNLAGSIGVLMTMVQLYSMLLLGRVIWGVAVGIQSVG